MAASDLKDLFSLENDNNIANLSDESLPAKRIKNNTDTNHLEDEFNCEKYSLETLWDSSQYEEEHSIETFIEKASNFL